MTAPRHGFLSYTELADLLDDLPVIVREARRARRLSLRATSAQSSVPHSTLYRVERGEDCSLSNVVAILRWLDRS
jgi:predicted transcriptional regulator